jgi:hypothetical protein
MTEKPQRAPISVLAGLLGQVTLHEKTLDRLCTFLRTNPSSLGVAEMDEAYKTFKGRVAKYIDAAMDYLEDEDFPEDSALHVQKVLQELSDRSDKACSAVLEIHHIWDQAAPPPAPAVPLPAAVPPPAAAAPPKVCEALRPFTLKPDHQPNILRTWFDKYDAFARASRLDGYAVKAQHAFMFSCVSPHLENRIKENDAYRPDLPIAGDNDSIFALIREEFRLRFPLFNRRLEFFRYNQSSGQKFTDYMMKLRQKGDEADLAALNVEQLYIFRYITGITDAKLRERFLKLESPTLEDLKREARAYEVGAQALRAMDGSAAKAAKVDNKKNNGSKNKGNNNKSGASASQKSVSSTLPNALKGICHICGAGKNDDHQTASGCKADKSKIYCDFCKKTGHDSRVCYKKHNYKPPRKGGKSNDSKASRAQSRPASPVTDDSTDERTSIVRCRRGKSSNRPTPLFNADFVTTDGKKRFTFRATPDSGATRTIFAKNILKQYGIKWEPTTSSLVMADDSAMDTTGRVKLRVESHSNHEINGLVSADLSNEILISWHDLKNMGILPPEFPDKISRCKKTSEDIHDFDASIADIKKEYADVLDDHLGPEQHMSGPPMTIKLRTDVEVKPCRMLTARKIPIHYQAEAEKTINSLLEKGVIKRGRTNPVGLARTFCTKTLGSRAFSDGLYSPQRVRP